MFTVVNNVASEGSKKSNGTDLCIDIINPSTSEGTSAGIKMCSCNVNSNPPLGVISYVELTIKSPVARS